MNTPEPCSVYDPCTYVVYQELRDDFIFAVFDNGLVMAMPYKVDSQGEKVIEWKAAPIYYRRN